MEPDGIARTRRAIAEASANNGRGALFVAIAAGLALGLGIAGFQSAPPALRLQAWEILGVGAPRSCEEARELGIAPQRMGDRYYFAHLDFDKDGVSCTPVGNGFR
ncbi:excalibur calcium-binding domain-containing protein [Falsiroseomonas sp. HW251]|uniref:excalibur calcium-binding domain-containing protein n=1 Tax=Falsiroseomonas sp. HW251 TaxID=3390998 RepID=UPI003D323291